MKDITELLQANRRQTGHYKRYTVFDEKELYRVECEVSPDITMEVKNIPEYIMDFRFTSKVHSEPKYYEDTVCNVLHDLNCKIYGDVVKDLHRIERTANEGNVCEVRHAIKDLIKKIQ